jgi:hypothetical protein
LEARKERNIYEVHGLMISTHEHHAKREKKGEKREKDHTMPFTTKYSISIIQFPSSLSIMTNLYGLLFLTFPNSTRTPTLTSN